MTALFQASFAWVLILCHPYTVYGQICSTPNVINSTGHFYMTNSFQDSTIYCGSSLNKCYIKCQGIDFCKNLYIECHSKECVLDCATDTACQDLNFYSYYADSTSIRCYGSNTCLRANFQIVAQDNVSPLSKSLDVHCERPRACDTATFTTTAVTDITVTCTLYVLTCVSSKWYIDGGNNDLNFNMNCRGCAWSDVHVSGGSSSSQAHIECNAVHHTQLTGSCGLQQFWCDLSNNACTVDCVTQSWQSCGNHHNNGDGTLYCSSGQGTTCISNYLAEYGYGVFTVFPTSNPTPDAPTPAIPTLCPTMEPTPNPTSDPSIDPTYDPTADPTIDPTNDPTTVPTKDPTVDPTTDPTNDPTTSPTKDPTFDPTTDPTYDPTEDPTTDPTNDPTTDPTFDPTADPTTDPTNDPTSDPTIDPTNDPTTDPTFDPTSDPTTDPTNDPTTDPTNDPTAAPTVAPSLNPTLAPSIAPSLAPSLNPTLAPSIAPTSMPTPLCHCAKYKGEMYTNDILWGGESFVSYNCRYLLTVKKNGNLILKWLVGKWINPFKKDEYGNYIRNINDRCGEKMNQNGWQTGWYTTSLVANYSGESVPKLILEDGSLVVYEEEFKNVPGIKPIFLWRSNDMKNIGNNMVLRLTDEACLVLNKYGKSANIDTAVWYKCLAVDSDESLTTTTNYVTTLQTSSQSQDDDTFDANSNQKKSISTWWIWLLIILSALLVLIAFACFKRYSNNKKLITNVVITSMVENTSDEMDPEMEGYKDNDMETTAQIEKWCMETNMNDTPGEFMIEMQNSKSIDQPQVISSN